MTLALTNLMGTKNVTVKGFAITISEQMEVWWKKLKEEASISRSRQGSSGILFATESL